MGYQARNLHFMRRGEGGCRVRNGFTLLRWENWVNTELPAENSGSQKGHRSRLQKGRRLGRELGIEAAKEEIRPEIRGSGCRRWGSGRKYGTLRGSGTRATEKGIQVRNTGFAAGNWRFSAPTGLGRTWALRRTGRGPAGSAQPPPFPRLSACDPSGPPKAAAGSPTPSPPDAASEPERPGRGGPNGGRPPANRRRKPARSPPPPPRRSPRARGGVYLTAAPGPAHAPAQ